MTPIAQGGRESVEVVGPLGEYEAVPSASDGCDDVVDDLSSAGAVSGEIAVDGGVAMADRAELQSDEIVELVAPVRGRGQAEPAPCRDLAHGSIVVVESRSASSQAVHHLGARLGTDEG